MALAATVNWELRATATAGNLNGGGFNAALGGVDYTLQDAAQLNPTDLTTSGAGATTITTTGFTFTSQMVGNVIHITAGTNFQAGWYEIVTFTNATNVVLDRTPTSGAAGSVGVGYVGGAMSLNSTLDDDFFEVPVAGNIIYMKNGAFTLGEAVSVASASATTTTNIFVFGYNATRGDNPTGSNRPTISAGANSFTFPANWQFKNIILTGTTTPAFSVGANSYVENCKSTNTSTVATRQALALASGATCVNNEFVSQAGTGISSSGNTLRIYGNYIHDSDIGVSTSGASSNFGYNIFATIKTAAVTLSGTTTNVLIYSNTLYGTQAQFGIGLRTTGVTAIGFWAINNILYGLATGIEIATVQQDSVMENYNDFNNNGTNRTLISTGPNSITTAPSFTSVQQLTGSTATTSGSVLTQSGGDFSTVTDNVDYLYLVSGTGTTNGIFYLITSHTGTTVTLNNAPGTNATADKVWFITTGHNFGVGTAMKATGFPGAFQGGFTTGYLDMGAVQRQEPAGSAATTAYTFS